MAEWRKMGEYIKGIRGGSRILERGGAWGVGDKLAVRSSQVCAPGGV